MSKKKKTISERYKERRENNKEEDCVSCEYLFVSRFYGNNIPMVDCKKKKWYGEEYLSRVLGDGYEFSSIINLVYKRGNKCDLYSRIEEGKL